MSGKAGAAEALRAKEKVLQEEIEKFRAIQKGSPAQFSPTCTTDCRGAEFFTHVCTNPPLSRRAEVFLQQDAVGGATHRERER